MYPVVYLSGGMTGLKMGTAKGWREHARLKLPGWVGVSSPLRGEDGHNTTVIPSQWSDDDRPFFTNRGLATRDRFDVKNCSAMIVNLRGAVQVSIGTMIEVGWAVAYDKPVILVMDPEGEGLAAYEHAILLDSANFITEDLDEACWIAETLLEPYRPPVVHVASGSIQAGQTVQVLAKARQGSLRGRQGPSQVIPLSTDPTEPEEVDQEQPVAPQMPMNVLVAAREAAQNIGRTTAIDQARERANKAAIREHAQRFKSDE